MNLPPFPDDYVDTSPESRRRLIAWGLDCAKMGNDARSARLERWGRSEDSPLLQRCEDGYWTPWHIAQAAIDAIRGEQAKQSIEAASGRYRGHASINARRLDLSQP